MTENFVNPNKKLFSFFNKVNQTFGETSASADPASNAQVTPTTNTKLDATNNNSTTQEQRISLSQEDRLLAIEEERMEVEQTEQTIDEAPKVDGDSASINEAGAATGPAGSGEDLQEPKRKRDNFASKKRYKTF